MEIKTIEDINEFKTLLRSIIIKDFNNRSCTREEWLQGVCAHSVLHRIEHPPKERVVKIHTLLHILKSLGVYVTIDNISSSDTHVDDINKLLMRKLKEKLEYLHKNLRYVEIEERYDIPKRRISSIVRGVTYKTGYQISLEYLILYLAAVNKLITVKIEE